ncbi:MAG: hypothetical protein SNJ84_09175 [Verrucomicrobiia bacterium]
MDGDYSKFNRFLAIAGLLGMISLGLVVVAVANQNDVHQWDPEKVKTAIVDTSTKAKNEVTKFFERKPKNSSCNQGGCNR